MNRAADDEALLQRYLDGELESLEQGQLRERLAHSRELRAQLRALQSVGDSLRIWSAAVRARTPDIAAATMAVLERRRRPRPALFASSLLGAALALWLGWSSLGDGRLTQLDQAEPGVTAPAAIEQLDSGARQAQVFLVGATPVVWLADDELGEDAEPAPGPG